MEKSSSYAVTLKAASIIWFNWFKNKNKNILLILLQFLAWILFCNFIVMLIICPHDTVWHVSQRSVNFTSLCILEFLEAQSGHTCLTLICCLLIIWNAFCYIQDVQHLWFVSIEHRLRFEWKDIPWGLVHIACQGVNGKQKKGMLSVPIVR